MSANNRNVVCYINCAINVVDLDTRCPVSYKSYGRIKKIMAEREGFEPSVPFPVHSISNATQSAALSSLHIKLFYKLSPKTG